MKAIIALIFFFNIALFSQNQYVNTFIGTGGHGHTFPGATVPFGMVQLSPDTDIKGWDWCSGYHASDSSIMGFSHTHLSGTGASDYGDIMFMPTFGDLHFKPGPKENPQEGYRSAFSHKSEIAEPGYYSVYLDDYKTKVELSATERCGIQRYNFDSTGAMHLIVDLEHGIHDKVKEGYIKIVSDNKIVGYRNSGGWARDHTVYFVAEFSKPIQKVILFEGSPKNELNELRNEIVKAALDFNVNRGESLTVKVGISHVNIEGAEANFNTEIKSLSFDEVKKHASELWEKELSKIKIVDDSEENKTKFYTALYRCMIHPNLFNDVNGNYMGMDRKVHNADHNVYTVYSLWDTFRALHPLLTIIDKERTTDFIKSMLLKYKEAGLLPVWELAGNETWTMIGYHSVPVIVDAYFKGVKGFEIDLAYEAIKHSAMVDHQGLEYYKSMGYVPMDKANDAVSRTLEYAYDDWCIAMMAKDLGKDEDYKYFIRRAENYRNVFDTTVKFARGRRYDGTWRKDFDPMDASGLGAGEFTEGNSWQYTWFVPQDISGLIQLMGGENEFVQKLDKLFTTGVKDGYYVPSDMSGLIGQYAHGNEPSHHIAYLYDYAGKAYKTQERVRYILDSLYTTGLNGFPGNEDCGQMSAWFVFSSLGFYPVTPGSNIYAVGTPMFDEAIIKLGKGKSISIKTIKKETSDFYVSKIEVNGKISKKAFLNYSDLGNGAEIKYYLASSPVKDFGANNGDRPKSEITEAFVPTEEYWVFEPYVTSEATLFSNSKTIELKCTTENALIRYTIDGSDVDENSTIYTKPFTINKSLTLKARAEKAGMNPSTQLEKKFIRAINRSGDGFIKSAGKKYPDLILKYPFAKKYSGTGQYNLLDGILGSDNFFDGHWNGFQGVNIDAEIDLGKITELGYLGIRMLEQQGSWIFYPKEVEFRFSVDGINWDKLKPVVIKNEVKERGEGSIKVFDSYIKDISVRYIRVIAKNIGELPHWHGAAGYKAWLFADEIIIGEK